MTISAEQVNELRQKTGLGLMECKKALTESDGNVEKAIEELRKKGLAKAAKKADRVTSQGRIETYIHGEGRVGVMVEVHCETDFVAKNDQFKEFVHDIALHIAGVNPIYIKPEDVPAEVLDKEKEIFSEQLKNEGKPENIIEKIMAGKVNKYYEEVCLLKQPFLKDNDKTVEQYITEQIATIGENIKIVRFTRYELASTGNSCG